MTFKNFTVPQLRDLVREFNLHNHIRGYSKMTKDKIVDELNKHLVFVDGHVRYNVKTGELKSPERKQEVEH